MNQNEKRVFLIKRLLKEQPGFSNMQIPIDTDKQKTMLRSLMNVRMPGIIDDEFISIQDEYLQQVNAGKGVVTLSDIEEIQPDVYIWKGDITRLKAGAIVNAANSGMPARDYIYQDTTYDEQIRNAARMIRNAEYVLIGAGAGMSTAAGAQYGGKFFEENFGEFICIKHQCRWPVCKSGIA